MKTKFKVTGDLPPKKDGALSMWSKPLDSRRLEKLRTAAARAFKGKPPLTKNIRLNLIVNVGMTNDQSTGDLDNFVTGVCDGLMAANPRTKLNELWNQPSLADIHPSKAVGIIDDAQVVLIKAHKLVGKDSQLWYEVSLEGD